VVDAQAVDGPMMVIRRPVRYAVTAGAVYAVAMVPLGMYTGWSNGRSVIWVVLNALAYAVLFGSMFGGLQHLFGRHELVQLRPQGVLVRRRSRSPRLLPWYEIGSIEVHPSKWFGQHVYLHGAFGQIELPAPYRDRIIHNPNFDAEVGALFAWWEYYRGPVWWRPAPPGPAFLW
jgi:hypothetical protein